MKPRRTVRLTKRGTILNVGRKNLFIEISKGTLTYEYTAFTRTRQPPDRSVFVVARMGHLRWWRWRRHRRGRGRRADRSLSCRLQRAVEYVGRSQSSAEGFGALLVSGEQRRSRQVDLTQVAHSYLV